MGNEVSQDRTGARVQALIVRELSVLMIKHSMRHWEHWCLPGGSLEKDEIPDEAVLRALNEACQVDGHVLRLTSNLIEASGVEMFTFLVDIGDQEPHLKKNSKTPDNVPQAVDLKWLTLEEIPERDRAFLWQAGLMTVPGFLDQVENWGDDISCPECIG
jgi:8-oxo-dGTP diphosphatase